MRSLNRVMLLGNLAADVDCRQTKAGSVVANFPLATNRVAKGSDGKKVDIADFHRVTAWGKLGEICNKYLAKGTAIYLEGKLINKSFDDLAGKRQYRTEIVADDVRILTWKKSSDGKKQVGVESIAAEEEEEEAELVAA